jgi:signal transduction histidine kinase/ligand-binding sensor domain-containing protein
VKAVLSVPSLLSGDRSLDRLRPGRTRVHGKFVESPKLVYLPVSSTTRSGSRSVRSPSGKRCVSFARKVRLLKFLPLRCFFPLFLLAAIASALDPHQPLSQLYHTSWSAKDGVNGEVYALAQTTDGFLWVGTSEGLLRFDGISFERYRPENGSLMGVSVSALMAVPDGGLWVGFRRGGASFLKNGRVTNYSDADGFPVSTVRCFARTRTGDIWAAVAGGFVRLEGQRWQQNYEVWNYPAKSASRLLVDREGTLWVAAGDEILFLPEGQKQFERSGIRASGLVSVFTQAPDGAIFFADSTGQVHGFRHHTRGKIEALPTIMISSFAALFDHDGALWVGNDGLYRVPFLDEGHGLASKDAAENFTERQGLSNQSLETILEDREGNIWVGTDGGLDRFRLRNVAWFPLKGSGPYSLVAGADGQVLAGSRGGSAVGIVGAKERQLLIGGPVDVFTVYRDPDGSAWFSGDNSLSHWQDGKFVNLALPDPVEKLSRASTPRDPIIASSITKDGSGGLWVAFGGSGEFRFKDGVWTFVALLPDHPDWAANYAFTDTADRVWLCWGDRVARYDHGNIRIFGTKEGLDVGPPNVIAGQDQELWVGGESGLSLFQEGRFRTIQSAEPAGFSSVNGIVATRNDGLWLSTGSGIVHIPEGEVDEIIVHPEHKAAFELFDLISDLPEPIQRGYVYSSAAIQANDGKIWFAARGTAIRLDPAHIYRNPLAPPVAIRSVVADDKRYSPFSNPTLPALTNNLRIEYAALSLSIPERVRFRYKLENLDNEWHDAGGRREAFFTRLAPGRYSFRVIACNNDGVWNEEGATLVFTVVPAWYQTPWFRALCVVAGFLVLWIFYRLRVRQVARAIKARFDERLDERTRIARDLHDTFLQTIRGSKLVADAALHSSADLASMRRAMEQLSVWLEQATHEGRAALASLRTSTRQKNDLAAAFRRAMEECRIHTSMETILSVAGDAREMHPIVRDEVYRIGYEAIRNACVHSQASQLLVELRYDHDLTLRISDNGVGIDPAIADRGREGHFGLQGMRERAVRIVGKLTVVSSAASGTEIKLVVPGGIIYRKPDSAPQGLPAKIMSFFNRTDLTTDPTDSDR